MCVGTCMNKDRRSQVFDLTPPCQEPLAQLQRRLKLGDLETP